MASELSALDYLYEVLLENHESGNCNAVLKEEIHDLGSKGNIFCRRKILSDKSIFALIPRISTTARQRKKTIYLQNHAKKMEIA